MTLTDLCEEIKNWFDVSRHYGEFEIKDGTIDLDFLQEGQFFRIIDSTFNDGVYQYPATLKNEAFNGSIWALAIPNNVISLVDEINAWEEKYNDILNSPYQSESFGGYSYTKGSDQNDNVTWQSHFRKQLNKWRKI